MNGVCDKYCGNCYYNRRISECLSFCNYYLATGERRPCEAGTGCTVKVRVKYKRHRKKKNPDGGI